MDWPTAEVSLHWVEEATHNKLSVTRVLNLERCQTKKQTEVSTCLIVLEKWTL